MTPGSEKAVLSRFDKTNKSKTTEIAGSATLTFSVRYGPLQSQTVTLTVHLLHTSK